MNELDEMQLLHRLRIASDDSVLQEFEATFSDISVDQDGLIHVVNGDFQVSQNNDETPRKFWERAIIEVNRHEPVVVYDEVLGEDFPDTEVFTYVEADSDCTKCEEDESVS